MLARERPYTHAHNKKTRSQTGQKKKVAAVPGEGSTGRDTPNEPTQRMCVCVYQENALPKNHLALYPVMLYSARM